MAQIFHRSTNTISRVSIYGFVFIVAAAFWTATEIQRSPWGTVSPNFGIAPEQPVPFSHEHHVGGLGIDCRYCHTSVEVSGFAGIPPTDTCMNCHAQIWTNADMLEPVRASFRNNQPLVWTRVNDLPDYVYFDHSIHVNKGVGCNTCHGPVDKMPLTYQAHSLQMEWCLDCHRDPEKYLRPKEEVFNMRYWQADAAHPVPFEGADYSDQLQLGAAIRKAYNIQSEQLLTSCSTCHR